MAATDKFLNKVSNTTWRNHIPPGVFLSPCVLKNIRKKLRWHLGNHIRQFAQRVQNIYWKYVTSNRVNFVVNNQNRSKQSKKTSQYDIKFGYIWMSCLRKVVVFLWLLLLCGAKGNCRFCLFTVWCQIRSAKTRAVELTGKFRDNQPKHTWALDANLFRLHI